MKHIIIGNGQIAHAMHPHLVGSVKFYDKGEWENLNEEKECETIMHICIPFNYSFVEIVNNAIKVFSPDYVIVHSTVSPGTTRKINAIKKLYSPVNGRHEDGFSKNIAYYRNMFAGNICDFRFVSQYFSFNVEYWGENFDELEYSKINCTNYTYWNLIFQKFVKEHCEKNGYDFESVYTKWNNMYNNGMGVYHPTWKRPTYKYIEGLPGGHCLRPNIHLVNDDVTKILREFEKNHEEMEIA